MGRRGEVRRSLVRAAAAALAAGVLWLIAPAGAGAAELHFCAAGSGAGQCDRPEGLAVDRSTGHLYVTDRGNRRIDVFDEGGSFLFAFGWNVNASAPAEELQKCTTASGCKKGSAGSGAGQFAQIEAQAVAADSSSHAVFVFDRGNRRVSKFDAEGSLLGSFGAGGSGPCQLENFYKDAIAVGPGGTVYVGDTRKIGATESDGLAGRVQKYNPTTFACEGESELFNGPISRIGGLVVDEAGSLYATVDGVIRKYEWGEPTASLLETIDAGVATGGVGVDAAGHLWAGQLEGRAQGSGSDHKVITEYSTASGETLARFGYGKVKGGLVGLAPYPGAGGGTFASEDSLRVSYLEAPPIPPGPIVAPDSVAAREVGNTQVTLEAEANPEGKAAQYHFDYVTQADYEAQGNSFEGPATVTGTSAPLGAANLFHVHYAEEVLGCPNPLAGAKAPKKTGETAIEAGECLIPETPYRFRVVVSNPDNAEGSGQARAEGTFTTKAPLEIIATFATEAGTDSARLNATVKPLGIPTTGHFQIVTQEEFEASGFEGAGVKRIPTSGELDFGAAKTEAVTRGATVNELTPGTSYRYRVLATDPLLEEASKPPIAGEAKPLRAFLLPTAFSCPENEAFRSGPGAALADCRGYEMVSPLEKEGGNVVALEEGFIELPAVLNQASVPGAGEPQRVTYGTYRAMGGAASAPFTAQYLASRGKEGWESESLSPPKGRTNEIAVSSDTELKALSPNLCEAWWLAYASPKLAPAAIEGQPNLYRRSSGAGCGLDGWEALTTLAPPHSNTNLELQGAATGGAGTIYTLNDSLGTEAPGPPAQPVTCTAQKRLDCTQQLYYQPPGEGPPRYVCVLPSGNAIASGGCSAGQGVSDSGQFRRNNLANALSADGSQVYWSAGGKLYLRLNPGQPQSAVAGGECTEAAKACTLPIAEEAEAEAGSSGAQYWAAAKDGSVAFFETGGRLYEYERATEEDTLIAEGLQGVAGASEDGTRVYFVSNKALAGVGANPQGEEAKAGQPNLYLHDSARPEGERLVFVARLTSADVSSYFSVVGAEGPAFNTSHLSPDGAHLAFMTQAAPKAAGLPDERYDNKDASGNGEPDAEVYLFDAAANGGAGRLVCASCNPTGARPIGANIERKGEGQFWAAAHIPGYQNSLYTSRALASDGKRLYFESTDALAPKDSNGASDVYQWEAAGTGSCKEGAPDYFASNGGCIDLISTGQSARESQFLDADPTGHDVFFATLQSLVSPDYGLVDVYDARVGGGFAAPPPPEPECEAEACQHPAPAPGLQTPASQSYEGPGNVEEKEAKKPCPKGKVKKHGHCVKKQKKHKKKAAHAGQGRAAR